MAALTLFLLMVSLHLVVSADQNITAEPGDNITLPCRSADNRPVKAVEWDRTDPEPDHVLLYRNDQIDPELTHSSFQNRVDLQDRQMKDGDVSLLLNNVMIEDSGTYECKVDFSQSNRRKRSVDFIRTIQLKVSPPPPGHKEGQIGDKEGRGQDGGQQDGTSAGQTGLIVGLVVSALVVLMIPAVIVIIVKRRSPLYHPPPHKEAEPGPP